MTPTGQRTGMPLTDDPVERLLRAGAPSEPVEELALLAELEASMFGTPTRPVMLSRYVVLRRIASGGAGVVYAGYDPGLERGVAIKLLAARRRRASMEDTQSRLLREAQVLARLAHPNVVSVFDVGTYDENAAMRLQLDDPEHVPRTGVFMVMELVHGVDLAQWLRSRPRGWREVLDVFIAAGRGLAAAHDAGVVHRDFKPANVIVGDDGRVRVLDFGIACAPDREQTRTDASGRPTLLGTPVYMAPEQHRGVQPDAAADQFAFFVALWEGLYGGLPFDDATVERLAELKESGPPEAGAGRGVPRWLRRTLTRGLAPRPEDRFGSLVYALERIERGRRRSRGPVLATVATAIAIPTAVWAFGDAAAACPPARAELDGVWDREAAAALETAFAASGRPFAAAAAQQVEHALDRWADDWAGVREAACMSRSPAIARCLDRQRLRLAGLVEVFRTADSSVVERAVDAVAALPPVGECIAASSRDDGELATEDAEVEQLLARAEALLHAGFAREAVGLAHTVAEAARTARTRAAAAIVLGAAQFEAGEGTDAEQTLGGALAEAERAGEEDLAVRALIELAAAVSRSGGRYAEAERLAAWAEARLAHRGRRDALDVRAAVEIGALRRNLGRLDEARETLDGARTLAVDVYGTDHPRVAEVDNELGNVLDRQGRWHDALEIYRRALASRLATFGAEHPKVAVLHNNLGNVLTSLGAHEEALAEYGEALRIYENALGPAHPSALAVRNNLAVLAVQAGRLDEGLAYHERVLAERRASLPPDHPLVLLSENNVGATLEALGRHREALAPYRHVLEVRERSLGPDHPDVATSLNNLGSALAAIGDASAALELHRRALAIRERVLGADHPDVATSLVNLGLSLAQLGRDDEARAALERARVLRVNRAAEGTPELAAIDAALARLRP